MARLLEQPDRSAVAADEVDAFDRVTSRFAAGSAGGYFGALLNAPVVCDALNSTSLVFRAAGERSTFDARRREWVDVVVARELQSRWMLRAHLDAAIDHGISPESIRSVWTGASAGLGDDAPLVDYIRQVVRGTVDDESFHWLEGELGSRGAVEYTAFICWVTMNTRLIQALGVEEISVEELDRALEHVATREEVTQ
jgi:alkylhydroperoxidase family enzyme